MDALHRKPECGITASALRGLSCALVRGAGAAPTAIEAVTDAIGHRFKAIDARETVGVEVCVRRVGILKK